MQTTMPTLKPRNPLALAARLRHAGSHLRSASGLRHQARRALQRELRHLQSSP